MKKILIVDDTRFMRTTVSAMLAEHYETVSAASGEEALELYGKEKPDLILADLIMPGMSGLELQKALREKYRDPAPFVFMSADENEESESRGLESGAVDFIRKPFRREVLLRRVGNIMRQMERIRGLRQVAETDPMTGLFNKAYVSEVLERLCARSAGILMMVDLDSFKLVNDIYGHSMGDRVLSRFGEILRSIIRGADVAGRIGGDEFIVFLQDVREEETVARKTRQINDMLTRSAREYMGEDMGIPLGASVGAVLAPDEGTVFADLFHKADKALYQVKQNGKHGYAFYRSGASRREEEKTAVSTLDQVRMILEERNRQPGAYELGFESFRGIYRFLIRTIENYHRPVELILFTVDAEGTAAETAAELFGGVLAQSLRRSDVYTRSGRNQYLALLPEMEGQSEGPIPERILRNWQKAHGDKNAEIRYETTLLNR